MGTITLEKSLIEEWINYIEHMDDIVVVELGDFIASGYTYGWNGAYPTSSLVEFNIDVNSFEEYDVGCNRIGINLRKLYSIVNFETDIVQLNYDDGSLFVGDYDSRTIQAISPDNIYQRKKVELNNYTQVVSLESNEFIRLLNEIAHGNGYIDMYIFDNKFHVSPCGDEKKIEINSNIHYSDENIHTAFNPMVLDVIGDVVPKNIEIDIKFGDKYPIEVSWGFQNGTGVVKYTLSPYMYWDDDVK